MQRLQVARRELALESAINRLDRFDLVILDDFAYVSKDQAETSVLFELISARYRATFPLHNSQPAVWRMGQGLPRPSHDGGRRRPFGPPLDHFELNVESYRRRTALQRKQQGPASRATPKNVGVPQHRRISTASTSPNDPLFSS